jgi:ABC-type nitrate/sulfonate/bicarbonate transport system permease component
MIEHARPALRPDPRGTPNKAVLGLLAGLVAGLVLAVLFERLRYARSANDPDVLELLALSHRFMPRTRGGRS